MKYIPMKKGMFNRIGLYSKSGEKLKIPKDLDIKYKIVGGQIYFELIFDEVPVTPAIKAVEAEGHVWTMYPYDGGFYYLDTETLWHSPIVEKEIENILISRDGKLIIDGRTNNDLFLDTDTLGLGVNNRYLFSSLIGAKNADGKCAIIDCETNAYLTNFEFETGKYDIVEALNNETTLVDFRRIFVIENEKEGKKNYLLVSEDGKFVTRFDAEKYLWKFDREEKIGTDKKHYVYVAFASKTKDGKEYTKILKIDSKTEEIVFETNIRGIVDKENQFREDFIQLDSGEIIMKTSETDPKSKTELFGVTLLYPDGKAKVVRANENTEITRVRTNIGKSVFDDGIVFITKKSDENGEIKSGAVKLTKDHVVEILLENEWNKVEFKKEPNGKYFLDFISKKKYGRIPLEGSSEGYVSSVASFVSLSTKHFSHILSKPIRPKQDKKKQMSDSTSRTEVSSISKPSLFDLLGNPKQNGEE